MLSNSAILAGVLTTAGASILLAGVLATTPTDGLPSPAEQDAASQARSLTNPDTNFESPTWKSSQQSDRDQACMNSLNLRASLRAYEGAPPTIPHDIESFTRTKSCLDCHGDGFVMGTRVAHPMPHPYLAACEQCHVTQEPPLSRADPGMQFAETSFEGLFRTGPATRAWDEAPPTIPHGRLMRTNCLACHGTHGYEGLQTTHPERANCIQCHVGTPE
jgi:cytochrome c-type protein NapB